MNRRTFMGVVSLLGAVAGTAVSAIPQDKFPTWSHVLDHIGKSLDPAIKPFMHKFGVISGRRYLELWIASLLQDPLEPLPYLFLFGEQEVGKSLFHEAIALLLPDNQSVMADWPLHGGSYFNKELESAVLCYVEEMDGKFTDRVYNRLKEWVTKRTLHIEARLEFPRDVPNTTHWIQCSSDPYWCPIFPGPSCVTMIHVAPPTTLIRKSEILAKLEAEKPAFREHLMALKVPRVPHFSLPVLAGHYVTT